jgi:large subunit ribosomal protein L7A
LTVEHRGAKILRRATNEVETPLINQLSCSEEVTELLLDEIENSKKVIGSKQVKKAVMKGLSWKVYLADDAEHHIIEPLRELCRQHGVEVIAIDTMEELGNACGIEVGSAAVALIKE